MWLLSVGLTLGALIECVCVGGGLLSVGLTEGHI